MTYKPLKDQGNIKARLKMDTFYKQWQELQHRYFLPHLNLAHTQKPFEYLWCKERKNSLKDDTSCQCVLSNLSLIRNIDHETMDVIEDWCNEITGMCRWNLDKEHKRTNPRHVMANYIFHAQEHDVLLN